MPFIRLGVQDSNEAPPELNHTVDGDKFSQEHLNPTERQSSPEIVLSQSPRDEAFDEVVEAAKARKYCGLLKPYLAHGVWLTLFF